MPTLLDKPSQFEDSINIEHMCEELGTLKTALACLENNLSTANNDILEANRVIAQQKTDFENKIKKVETRFDNKLKVSLQTMTSVQEDNITKCVKSKDEGINKQKEVLSSLDARLQRLTSQIKKDSEENSCKCNENVPKWSDLNLVRESLNDAIISVGKDMDTLKGKSAEIDTKIESLSNQFVTPDAKSKKIENGINELDRANVKKDLATTSGKLKSLIDTQNQEQPNLPPPPLICRETLKNDDCH